VVTSPSSATLAYWRLLMGSTVRAKHLFHSPCGSCQHAIRPQVGLDPYLGFFGMRSRFAALAPIVLPSVCRSRIHLPAPLGSAGITRFRRYYGRSDSSDRYPRYGGLTVPCVQPSQPFRLQPPKHLQCRFNTLPLTALHSPTLPRGRLRHCLAGSSMQQAESSFLTYGLVVHLLLLSTPPHDDAVIFGYRPESVYLTGTFTLLTKHTHSRTRPGFDPGMPGDPRMLRARIAPP
jgi:hypothetical protein